MKDGEKLLAVLDFYPQYIDVIALRLEKEYGIKMPIMELNALLVQMSLWDEVKQEAPGWFSRNSGNGI